MTHETIIFENEGLIDIRAIKTFGVNVKETKNPFGYFGTGLKYAIAILLRNRQKITIYRGLEAYKFALKETEIRGEPFSIITMNGEELGFTSQLGKNWELWQAYRELYCNTLDENGTVCASSKQLSLSEDKTFVTVSGEAFLSIHNNRRDFILQSSPEEVANKVEIHDGNRHGFFCKSIFIGGLSKKSKFTYNLLDKVELTEDRTLNGLIHAEWEIIGALLKSENKETIQAVLTAGPEFFESELHFGYNSIIKPCSVFLEAVAELLSDHSIKINDSAVTLFRKYATEKEPKPIELTKVQDIQLQRAKDFSTSLGMFSNKFPIIVVETLGQGILGKANDKTIYLTLETFEMGTKMVAITLIEEYLHLSLNYEDMTREMQNYLFNKIISLGEELAGEPL